MTKHAGLAPHRQTGQQRHGAVQAVLILNQSLEDLGQIRRANLGQAGFQRLAVAGIEGTQQHLLVRIQAGGQIHGRLLMAGVLAANR